MEGFLCLPLCMFSIWQHLCTPMLDYYLAHLCFGFMFIFVRLFSLHLSEIYRNCFRVVPMNAWRNNIAVCFCWPYASSWGNNHISKVVSWLMFLSSLSYFKSSSTFWTVIWVWWLYLCIHLSVSHKDLTYWMLFFFSYCELQIISCKKLKNVF